MKLRYAIGLYLDDMVSQGRFTSERSEDSYRRSLLVLVEEVKNRDPEKIGREDIKRTLSRWKHPNTQARHRSMMISFFDWLMEEGHRKDNPARQTRRPKARRPDVYRFTFEEVTRFLAAARGDRERRIAYLGICAGLRREELRLLQGRHLARTGWIWVSRDIAKGGRERWVPVLPDLAPTVERILRDVAPGEFVLPSRQNTDVGVNRNFRATPTKPSDGKVIWRAVKRIAVRAGITADVGTHTMRHAFAEHVARNAGLRSAQMMLGHAALSTTEGYLGVPTLDELAASVEGVSFLPPDGHPAIPLVETVGIEPTVQTFGAPKRFEFAAALRRLFESPLLRVAVREMGA